MRTWPKRMGHLAVRLYLLPVMVVGAFIAIIFGLSALAFVIGLLAKLVS